MKHEKELTYKDNEGDLVVISEHVLNVLEQYKQTNKNDNEAAGVFLGEKRGKHIVITDLSIPGTGDFRNRHLVDRRGKHHQRKVNACFKQSGGTVNYVGEWHTHPECYPKPSSQDRTSWYKHLKKGTPKVVLIVGTEGFWIGKMKEGRLLTLLSCD